MGREEIPEKSLTQKQVTLNNKTIKPSIPAVHFYKLVLSGAEEELRVTPQGSKERVSDSN